MKRAAVATLVLASMLPTAAVLAQNKTDGERGADRAGKLAAGAQTTHTAKGMVKKVDAAAGRVTFAHEPVKSLNWPAMTMSFKVKDKALLDKLAFRNNVQFDFVEEGGDYVVTAVK